MKQEDHNEDKSFPTEWKYLIITAVIAILSSVLLIKILGV